MPIRSAHRQREQLRQAPLHCIGHANAHAHALGLLRQLRRHHTSKRIVDRQRHGRHGHAFERRLVRIDLHIQRITGQLHTVLDLNHARNISDGLGDALCLRHQRLRIRRIQLDLDRLRHRSKVADKVFHQLGQFHLDARHFVLDVLAHVAHHFLGGALVPRLQTHKEIAVIRLAKVAAQAGA